VTLIIILLLVILFSIIINRIATVALVFTGMSREMAAFLARSAFTTVGYPTSEAESVVKHPVRRRIIMLLMLLGNAGLVTVIATLFASMVDMSGPTSRPFFNIMVLLCGLVILLGIATSKSIDDYLFKLISWALKRWTTLESFDYVELLHLAEEYSVSEIPIEKEDWLAGRQLSELRLPDYGISVLGIHRADGTYEGGPTGFTYLRRGDMLLLYGARRAIHVLDRHRSLNNGETLFFSAITPITKEADDIIQSPAESTEDQVAPENSSKVDIS